MNNKKGFSLMEAVIALSVVVVVSICAMSIVLSSVSAKQTAIDKQKAQYFSDNAWECFKASDSETDFVSNMNFAESVTLEFTNNECVYTSTEHNFTANIKIDYTASRPTFSISVTDKDGKEIVAFTFEKAKGA